MDELSHNWPETLALFPLGSPLLPTMPMELTLFEPRYLKLMRERGDLDPIFSVALTKEGFEVGEEPEIHSVGTAASLTTAVRHADGRYAIAVLGTRRFRVGDRTWSAGYLTAEVEWLPERAPGSSSGEIAQLQARFIEYAVMLSRRVRNVVAERELPGAIASSLAPDALNRAFQVASHLPLDPWTKQALLEADPPESVVSSVVDHLERELRRMDVSGATSPLPPHAGKAFSPN